MIHTGPTSPQFEPVSPAMLLPTDGESADLLGGQQPETRARLDGYLRGRAAADLLLGSAIQELDFDATHNPVTGLPNARGFRRQSEGIIAAHPDSPIGVVVADLKSFKDVNDTQGHVRGDQTLQQVGGQFRDTDVEGVIGHVGGDEFVVLAPLTARQDSSLRPEDRTSAIVNRIHRIGEVLAEDPDLASVGFGIAAGGVVMEQGESLGSALQRADATMYADKQNQLRPLTEEQLAHFVDGVREIGLSGVSPRQLSQYIARYATELGNS